jgi:hypothetical protein
MAKRLRVVTTSEAKLKIIADFEAGKRAIIVGRDLVIPPTT